jgi:hypothetical protein
MVMSKEIVKVLFGMVGKKPIVINRLVHKNKNGNEYVYYKKIAWLILRDQKVNYKFEGKDFNYCFWETVPQPIKLNKGSK